MAENRANRKATGSFYTCSSIADYLANWAIPDGNVSVLEPSFGDGRFLSSALNRYDWLGKDDPEIYGVEMQSAPYNAFICDHPKVNAVLSDFMDYHPPKCVDAVIGNPPYVSLKKLSKESRNKTLSLMEKYALNMSPSGSLWMPFIVHATELLKVNGRLGFVLPYEITYVRYAFELWKYLSTHYGEIRVVRIYKDFFPEVEVETILFMAEKRGGHTDEVYYRVYNTLDDLFRDDRQLDVSIAISDILTMDKPFERALLPQHTMTLLSRLYQKGCLQKLIDDCKFKIGYVCGDKSYFHPLQSTIQAYKIHEENLLPCFNSSRQLVDKNNPGIETANMNCEAKLFYPKTMDEGEIAYIKKGEEDGIDQRYKCRVRKPWYMTPSIDVPDLILSVFGNVPKLISNNGHFIVSNSLLAGTIVSTMTKEAMICRWYNSLTLLMIELSVHSLGGGTLVLIPGETDRLDIISRLPEEKVEEVYHKIRSSIHGGDLDAAYRAGDGIVLKDIFHLSDEDISCIVEAVSILRDWRNPIKRRGD